MEKELEAPESDRDRRIADTLILFEEVDEQLGQGIIAEVQHKHDQKNKKTVTEDYLAQNFAVVWLYSGHFSDDRCLLSEPRFRTLARESVPREEVLKCLSESWTDWFHANKYIEKMRREMDLDSGMGKITLPPECVREILKSKWRETPWHEIISPPDEFNWKKGAKTRIPVKFPPDTIQTFRQVDIARNVFDGKIIRLTEHNASRECGECGDVSDFYYYHHGQVSEFRCRDHTLSEEELTRRQD
jgi:hypothetical protein